MVQFKNGIWNCKDTQIEEKANNKKKTKMNLRSAEADKLDYAIKEKEHMQYNKQMQGIIEPST